MGDFYRLLGVPRHANLDEIRRAYWQLARLCQSECGSGGASGRLGELRQAYEILTDRERRKLYDASWPTYGRIETTRSAADWLDDEVAVDFPSMEGVLGRIRAGFFGADRPTQTADVRLTRQQADRGGRVPVELAVKHTCPVCGGRGEIWMEPCAICSGSGEGSLPQQMFVRVPPGVRDGARLRFSVTPPYAPVTHVELRITVQ